MRGFLGYVVVDVETNGLTPDEDRVLEVAAVQLWPDFTIESSWSTLIDPGPVDVGRTDIHGIRPCDLTGAPSFGDVAGDIIERLRGRILVAHNAPFDVGFIGEEFARLGHAVTDMSTIDTLELARQRWPGERAGLDACCQRLGIPRPPRHSALEDAVATTALFQHLMGHMEPDTQPAIDRAAKRVARKVWPSLPHGLTQPVPREPHTGHEGR
ncbi:MAG: 3'-5' exonuclease [Propionibacteriaceae bacterium]|nr:3'-5' exonuclease [Propionibacteriaceae bacterium]